MFLAHFSVPNGAAAALIATDRLEGVEMITHNEYNIGQRCRYRDASYRLALSAAPTR